ncbi:heat-shock protein Hsp20 [Anoxybacillus gonensis]|uniref:Hsp20 family protein n=1 Tax=Anoxybacillus gonensis TaxID=198467 RepID=A0AAW7TI39_9BACL|nr:MULTISPECIES: Hsp20 family protein [Anoxybacillus]AXM90113.1 heat-shock protein Hsp20 [Anoxybacillus ayderensis G10]THD15862.1 heat-shock protein Hsp20 [Anoxybacillus ayderensis]AKS38630.1 heat-shock protein Hsp20 [Anoxybacillus gonensis]EMI09619.1 molecular chaperone [Anoxybacillus gonensis]KGP60257.1 heat-shock protein Hsp20 [Anoxybacillus gonensis]
MKKDLSHMLDSFFDDRSLKKLLYTLDEYVHRTFSPIYIPIDVRETKEQYIIIAHLPNVKRENVHLQFIDDTRLLLSVVYDEQTETIDDEKKMIHRQRTYERATKSIFLPYPVRESDIQASFQDGKLIIRLPQKKTFIPIE